MLDGKQIAAGVTSLQRPDISTEVVNTAGFWIDADRSVDPEQIVRGNIEILADGQLLAVWETLITKLKQNSEPSVGV